MSRGTARHTVRIAPELWEAAQAAADERGETLSDVIRQRLADYAREPKPHLTAETHGQ